MTTGYVCDRWMGSCDRGVRSCDHGVGSCGHGIGSYDHEWVVSSGSCDHGVGSCDHCDVQLVVMRADQCGLVQRQQ